MRTVHMMVGIPGSGKSTYVKKLAVELDCPVVASDKVRDTHPNWEEAKIWPEVYRLCGAALNNDQDVIFDATNITPNVRARFIQEVRKHSPEFSIGIYYFDTPWQECLRRVMKRNENPLERHLPPEVVASYARNMVFPKPEEGFVFIKIIDFGIEK